MKAESINFFDLFRKDNPFFKIPIYQRNYDWSISECTTLIEDILNTDNINAGNLFLGSIVYKQIQKNNETYNIIIDGQQRITSLYILLKALYDICNDFIKNNDIDNEPNLYQKAGGNKKVIRAFLLDEIPQLLNVFLSKNTPQTRLILNPYDQKQLELLLSNHPGLMDQDSNILKNYELFKNKLMFIDNDLSYLEIWIRFKKLEFISIIIGNEDDPQLIFESLNSKGKPLIHSDQVRNFLLMPSVLLDKENTYSEYWYKIENLCDKKNSAFGIENLIRLYLTIQNLKIPKNNQLYVEFKQLFKNKELDTSNVLKDIYDYAEILNAINSHNFKLYNNEDAIKIKEEQAINNTLLAQKYFDTSVQLPLIIFFLKLYKEHQISSTELLSLLTIFNSYFIRRLVCYGSSKSFNRIFISFIADLKKQLGQQSIVESFKEILFKQNSVDALYPRDDTFIKCFITKKFYSNNNSLLHYILHCFEKHYNRKESKDLLQDIKDKKISIEHIMPQNLNKEWQDYLGSSKAERIHKQYLNTIGNLTVTGYNSTLKDKLFNIKKNGENGISEYSYSRSVFNLNKRLAEFKTWKEDDINHRAQELAQLAVKLWPYDLNSIVANNQQQEEQEINYQICNLSNPIKEKGVNILSFTMFDQEFSLNNATDMIKIFTSEVFKKHPDKIEKAAEVGKFSFLASYNKWPERYFSVSPKVFITLNLDTLSKMKFMISLCNECGISLDSIVMKYCKKIRSLCFFGA